MISQQQQQEQQQQQSHSYDRHVPRGQKDLKSKVLKLITFGHDSLFT